MSKKIFLLRHGKTKENINGIYQGSSNTKLLNPDTMLNIQDKIQSLQLESILCSPLLRAKESANALNLNFEICDLLQECNMGQWELLKWSEIAKQYPDDIKTMANDYNNFIFPEGESIKNFIMRIQKIAEIFNHSKCNNILAITHGGIIRHLICHYLGLDYKNYLMFHPNNASLTCLEINNGRGILKYMGVE